LSHVGAPEGNKNGQKARVVYGALMRAIAQDDYQRLRDGIEKVLEMAAAGERWALEFIRDTADGKPRQAIEHSGPDGSPVEVKGRLEVNFVAGRDPLP
jgi:hypothetical protein